MRSISILNFKGGTGKTTVIENLADVLSRRGHLVLVIDADRQGNASTTFLRGTARPPATLTQVLKGDASLISVLRPIKHNLFLVPSDTDLDTATPYLNARRVAFYTLRRQLELLGHEIKFDYVLIDHAGAYTAVMEACLLASHEMIVPCELEPFSIDGLFSMHAKLTDTLGDHEIKNLGIIPYAVDQRYVMSKLYIKQLREMFGDDLILPSVRTDANVPKAQSVNRTVIEYAEEQKIQSTAVEDFLRLAHFIDGDGHE